MSVNTTKWSELAKYSHLSLVLHLQIYCVILIAVCVMASSTDRFKIHRALPYTILL
jgi:hypothetical protein